MEKHQKKQFVIGSMFIVFILMLAVGAFLLLRSGESCFDGVKNQNEEGIDCGGLCANECVVIGKPLQTLWVRFFPSGEGKYDLAAKIQNPNFEIGAGSFSYAFRVFNGSGKLISSREGASYILPNQTRYLVEPVVKLDEPPSRAVLSISEVSWEKPKLDSIELAVKNKDYKISLPGSITFSEATGTVVNKSDFDFDKIEAAVILFDERGNAVGANKTEMRTVRAKEERFFKVSWFVPPGAEVKSFDMQASTNIFFKENILKLFE